MDLQTRAQTMLGPRYQYRLLAAGTTTLAIFAAARLVRGLMAARSQQSSKIIASPRKSLQLLSAQKLDEIPYPPDALPGARDVDTPYGNIRVYEWGPEDGRKVLFVHGISTPCIAFAGMAKLLVERGCRVMLFDLFGRGYSDTPDPVIYPQDIQLWTSQILLVLASSTLSWTGHARFAMVGYSMGGGISAAFTAYFPEMVESLILIAPGGLIRPNRIATSSKLLYGGLLPKSVINHYVSQRLKGGPSTPPSVGKPTLPSKTPTAPVSVAESEIPAHPALASNSIAPIFPDRPRISPQNTVSWQVDAHPGFLPAFISSIKNAPISGEHERWRQIGRRQAAQRASVEREKTQGLKEGKVLVLSGMTDNVIIADEIDQDSTVALGRDNVKVIRLQGAHDLPIVNADGCVREIEDFWQE